MGTENGLDKGHSYLDSSPHVLFFCSSLYFSPCKEIQYLVLKDPSCDQPWGCKPQPREDPTENHKWFWLSQWLLWVSTLAMDLLYPGFLLHKKKNKTDYGFKLLWIVHFFLFNRFFCWWWWGRFLLQPAGCCLLQPAECCLLPAHLVLVSFYNCYRCEYSLLCF